MHDQGRDMSAYTRRNVHGSLCIVVLNIGQSTWKWECCHFFCEICQYKIL